MSHLSSMPGLQALWSETIGSPDVCVAVLDGPVDLAHPCFSQTLLRRANTLVEDEAGGDVASAHGTHVASVIFGQHGSGVSGIAPGCRGLIVPIFPPRGGAKLACSQLDLVRAIHLAVEQGADIINISGGELNSSGEADPLLATAIKKCNEDGILVIAAAGNDGCRCLHVPASVPSVLAVGAMNASGIPLEFTNWGDAYQAQGVIAPGEDIVGAVPGGGSIANTGTSFATPIVTGIAALLLSIQVKRGERRDIRAVRAAILESADPCGQVDAVECRRMLAGRLNVAAAHARLQKKTQRTNSVNEQTFPASVSRCVASAMNLPNLRSNHMTESPSVVQPTPTEASGLAAPAEEPAVARRSESVQASAVSASACDCNKGKAAPSPAYVLGQIGYDFGTESKRDAFVQLAGVDVHDPAALLSYLNADPPAAANVIWTLNLDATAIYAIQPYGPFASHVYDRLKEFLAAQIEQGAERVSIPGMIQGSVRLLNGQEVPLLYPDVRGMYCWSLQELVAATCGTAPNEESGAGLYANKVAGVKNFLERVYYEVRNLGVTSQERAMNYAATNAFQVSEVYNSAINAEMKLDRMEVERSPICRPGSNCWDVKLTFFHPAKRLEQARHVHRFTVDVSEVIPVTVGKVRDWDVY